MKAIIDQFVGDYSGPREKGTVNVFSELPYQNTFWRGDLSELKRILAGIGLKVNILFGPESKGISEWKSIPKAQFNLVVSPWLGIETARHIEKKIRSAVPSCSRHSHRSKTNERFFAKSGPICGDKRPQS